MTGRNLTGHNLTGHNLTGHNLTGHNLTGHNMTGRNLTGRPISLAGTLVTPTLVTPTLVTPTLVTPTLVTAILVLATLLGPAACKTGNPTGDGNNNDATVPPDDGTIDPDSSQWVDNDGDGYPAHQDCDDNNPDVYPGVARPCQSDCAEGWEVCLNSGQYTPCSATTDCTCETPGDTRQTACGMCGTGQSVCGLDQQWSPPTECHGEGVCIPGTMDLGDCEHIGTRSRLCTSECQYLSWDESACTGECHPGTREVTSEGCPFVFWKQERECNAEHAWETVIPCTEECLLEPRTGTADFKDDICIPGGPFIMGANPDQTGNPCDEPKHEVTLSAFFIDKFEVTVARYKECVAAGGCEPPVTGTSTYYFSQDVSTHPLTDPSWSEANAFCQWDGRRLATEAEWEKAARGPAPREVAHPWGDAYPTCDHVPAIGCPYSGRAPVDAHPAGASYYGVQGLGGNKAEWVSDWFQCDYYSVSPSEDPTGPTSSPTGEKVVRGYAISGLSNYVNIAIKRAFDVPDGWKGSAIRCARDGY